MEGCLIMKLLIWFIIILSVAMVISQARRSVLAEAQTIYIQGCKDAGGRTEWCVENSNEYMNK